jgi:hypothetical protein
LLTIKTHFSDFFDVSSDLIEEYGAFNISLINDLPLFIDPFLLFNSDDPLYQQLHDNIITYLRFLRDKALSGNIELGLLKAWFTFSEVKQNWLGYAEVGNRGSGLGINFASALNNNLFKIFSEFGEEKVSHGSHLEKLYLVSNGVGRDNISDFTTNLIKGFLLEYTQEFARTNISEQYRKRIRIPKVKFNYTTETWEQGFYDLPFFNGDYVLLTPKNILTKDDIWISKQGLYEDFDEIANSVSNDQLRAEINNYFHSILSNFQTNSKKGPTKKEKDAAKARVISQFPQIIDYYIRYKEEKGDEAASESEENVLETHQFFVKQLTLLVQQLFEDTDFYESAGDTYAEARARVMFLKHVIEDNDGYKYFYVDGKPIQREMDLQIAYILTWFSTRSDVNREVNNGRGPADFKISRGSRDKTLVEFKLASNSQLKRNLEKQVSIYEKANETDKALKVILYFTEQELTKVNTILRELKLENHRDIILIDARNDNKPSGSKA